MDSIDSGEILSYGVLKKDTSSTIVENAVQEIRNLGFTVVHSGHSDDELKILSEKFDLVYLSYANKFGKDRLKEIDEHNTIRLPLVLDKCFLDLANNPVIIDILKKLIIGKFILNQQNGIINPACQQYNQSAWHRDLPYQHFLTTTPLAISALFCLDDFNMENGATHVLPASHKHEMFPSNPYILKNGIQVIAPADSFIIMDCMAFHRGGNNLTKQNRRAVNNIYSIPLIKQQIDIPTVLDKLDLDDNLKELLGFKYKQPQSIEAFLDTRKNKP